MFNKSLETKRPKVRWKLDTALFDGVGKAPYLTVLLEVEATDPDEACHEAGILADRRLRDNGSGEEGMYKFISVRESRPEAEKGKDEDDGLAGV